MAENNINPTVMEQLVKDLGIDQLSTEKQQEVVEKMNDILLKRIFLETMQKLGEAGQEEFEKLTEQNIGSEEMENFFRAKIPNYDEMVMSVIEEFKQEMLSANIQ